MNNEETENLFSNIKIDTKRQRFPYCIVWTPIPVISWLFPVIGHTGICTSEGIIHDFAGSEYISVDEMAFGEPHKYIYLNPTENEKSKWDLGIYYSDKKFSKEEHNLFSNNCHSHVAYALNKIYSNKNHNMITIWWYFLIYGKYVTYSHTIKTYLGFIIILILFSFLYKILKI